MPVSMFRLLNFCRLESTRSPTWAKVGGSQPNALYSSTCFGVDMSHSWGVLARVAPVPFRGDGPHRASDNVGDLHQMVVYHIGEMVRRESVRLDDDEVILGVPLLVEPINDIAHPDGSG